jgi:hypothetical protein
MMRNGAVFFWKYQLMNNIRKSSDTQREESIFLSWVAFPAATAIPPK